LCWRAPLTSFTRLTLSERPHPRRHALDTGWQYDVGISLSCAPPCVRAYVERVDAIQQLIVLLPHEHQEDTPPRHRLLALFHVSIGPCLVTCGLAACTRMGESLSRGHRHGTPCVPRACGVLLLSCLVEEGEEHCMAFRWPVLSQTWRELT
jgi:hypothetical protein